LASLEEFSQKLLSNVKTFREHDDKGGVDVISSSCIACLAHIAVLSEAVGRTDPDAGEMYTLCDSALERLGMLTSELHFDEYTYLDVPLGVSPSFPCFPTVMTQTGGWNRTPGINPYQSSSPASKASPWKRAGHYGISGRSSETYIPIFKPDSQIASRQ
jgi:hypothetical protein